MTKELLLLLSCVFAAMLGYGITLPVLPFHIDRLAASGGETSEAAVFHVGAITGVFIGFILGLFSLLTPISSGVTLALWGLVTGAVIGALVGLLVHSLADGRRNVSSVSSLRAGRYDVVATADVVERARRLLSELPMSRVA